MQLTEYTKQLRDWVNQGRARCKTVLHTKLPMPVFLSYKKRTRKKIIRYMVYGSIVLALLALFIQVRYIESPQGFPIGGYVEIPEGVSVREAFHILKEADVVRSDMALRVLFLFDESTSTVQAGEYYFPQRISLYEVAQRITHGMFGFDPIVVTIPEGSTTYQIAELCETLLQKCDGDQFYALTQEKEGFLYPDTYHFTPNTKTEEVIAVLERTFYEKIDELGELLAEFGRPIHEIITMASLIEREAYDEEERKIISGILWNRINEGMLLQVDAVFGYIEERETFHPTFSDLEVESPYNTYKYPGLPPGPIGSPSLSSIEATVTPASTTAFYYLHGTDGILRTAETFNEHKQNRVRFLD